MTTKRKPDSEMLESDMYESLAKGVGGLILDSMDQTKGFIDTGILSLNYAISGKFVGGGMPIGITAEIFGSSSSGKTLIGTGLLRGCQSANGVAVFLDAERTINKKFAVKASHVDPKKLIVMEADTLETAFNKIFKVIRQARNEAKIPMDRPLVIIYDSIAVSPSEREFAETELDMEEASKTEIKEAGAGADKPGERAKIIGKQLRNLTPFVGENNATVVFINQLRSKIGVMFGNPETPTGGMALPFYCSTRMSMSSYKTIKDDTNKVIGTNVTVRNVKNKISLPFVEIKNLRLFYDRGIDPFGGLLELLVQERRIKTTGSGQYTIDPQYTGGKEVKFKSSKERNDVPAEILLDFPKLVDASDSSQVQYYVDMFGEALVSADEIKEEDVTSEE